MTKLIATYYQSDPEITFKSLTAGMELLFSEIIESEQSRPRIITEILKVAIDEIDGIKATPDLVRSLTISARDHCLVILAAQIYQGSGWFSADCQSCGASYDFNLDLHKFPRSPAGENFPVTRITTSFGEIEIEAPNGSHEEQIALVATQGLRPELALIRAICTLPAAITPEMLSPQDIEIIDTTAEELSGEVASSISSQCPECGAETRARIDILGFSFRPAIALQREVHLIARAYHWDEQTILELSEDRRQGYLALIREDQSKRQQRGEAA